jgi:Lecithin:cholesterol acyltransferase
LKTDKPVYIFNYDWRHSARVNGEGLNNFINYLINKSRANKNLQKQNKPFRRFDFITHSLGNAPLRSYIKQFDPKFERINKIIFTVPPFKGSIDIAEVILIGEGFFPNVKGKIRKLIRTFPGALELLPTYAGASRFSPGGQHNFFNYEHWQSNIILPQKINSDKLRIAEKFKITLDIAKKAVKQNIGDLSDLPKSLRDRILIICRDGYKTYQSMRVYKGREAPLKNFFDFENACRNKEGDGKVPHVSSCLYRDKINTVMVKDAWRYLDYSHGFVLKDERVQKLVNRFLFDKKKFDHKVHGGSIQRVVGLENKKDKKKDLPYWEPVLE